VDYKEEDGVLYYLKYGPFTVATSRPETKFGDVALAVNPEDARYQKYIGTEVEITTLDTATEGKMVVVRMPVVGDEAADMAFGTGIIKVTPAHDITDFEIGERHKLPMPQVIDARGKMMNAGRFDGLKASEARGKVIEELRVAGLVEREEKYTRNLAVCSRCSTAIEPLPSRQWFLKMGRLAKAALSALEKGETNIVPANFAAPYKAWLENTRDWCISRQLWWGHRLPVWFCKAIPEDQRVFGSATDCVEKNYVVVKEKPEICPICKKCSMAQTEDVCDTWFSSALWPFAGLSEGNNKRFYPSQVLITARDIINLWVGRMVFSGLEFMKKAPFKDVFIHATVLTKTGQRMSKSLGTGIDPITLVEKYGADATRFGIVWQAMGTQDIRFDEAAVVAGRKFANKIFNASRFVMGRVGNTPLRKIDMTKATEADVMVLGRADAAKKAVEGHLAVYEFGRALHALYDFFWHDYCDVYLEEVKKESGGETDAVLYALLLGSLKLLHPFMPFVTESIWQDLPHAEKSVLMVAEWDVI
jgi:valyl-tRNA synthetase